MSSTTQDHLYVGTVGPPSALIVEVIPGSTGLDVSLITSLVIKVRKPDKTVVTWTATVSNGVNFPGVPAATAAASYWVHPYDDGDLDQAGLYQAWPESIEPSATFGEASTKTFYVSVR